MILTTSISRAFFVICIGAIAGISLLTRSYAMGAINRTGTVEGVEIPMIILGVPLLLGLCLLAGSVAMVTRKERGQ